MNYLHDHMTEDDDIVPHPGEHRELTLGTPAILGIFTGLVLLCGLFFGIGYNMGSRTRTVTTAAIAPETPAPSPNFSGFKPAPGTPQASGKPTPAAVHPSEAQAPPAAAPEVAPTRTAPAPAESHNGNPPAPIERVAPPAGHAPSAAEPTTGSFIVQVAAVSHAEDADLLVNALKRKGYSVVSRSEPQDKLFHIQVGPFATKKDADTMRQRLATDGYNAIVK